MDANAQILSFLISFAFTLIIGAFLLMMIVKTLTKTAKVVSAPVRYVANRRR